MAKLTSKSRNALPKAAFAEPGKRAYPINDSSHARNALSRVSQNGSPAEKAEVRAAVHRKFPAIGDKATHDNGKARMAAAAGRELGRRLDARDRRG